jgi:hypothetical protein
MTKRVFRVWLPLLFNVLFAAQWALADVFDGMDVSVGTGGVAGSVTAAGENGSVRQFNIGGVPLIAMLNRDFSEHWSGSVQVQSMFDTINQQMARQGFAAASSYHIVGGARQLSSAEGPGDFFTVRATNRHNLSVSIRGGVFHYAATQRDNIENKISGSVWDVASGFEYRRNLSEADAVGLSVMGTIATLPASVDRLAAKTGELVIFWRVFL